MRYQIISACGFSLIFMILLGVSISYFSTQRCTYRISTAHARTHLTAFAHEHMIRSAHVCYVPSTYGITRYVHGMCTTVYKRASRPNKPGRGVYAAVLDCIFKSQAWSQESMSMVCHSTLNVAPL